jgi:hypothetical protein
LSFQGIVKLLVVLCILSGINIFDSFGCVEPSWWKWCVENKIYSSLMLYFMFSVVEGYLHATGAFEIYLNGE